MSSRARFPDQHRALAKGARPRTCEPQGARSEMIAAEIVTVAEAVAIGVQV